MDATRRDWWGAVVQHALFLMRLNSAWSLLARCKLSFTRRGASLRLRIHDLTYCSMASFRHTKNSQYDPAVSSVVRLARTLGARTTSHRRRDRRPGRERQLSPVGRVWQCSTPLFAGDVWPHAVCVPVKTRDGRGAARESDLHSGLRYHSAPSYLPSNIEPSKSSPVSRRHGHAANQEIENRPHVVSDTLIAGAIYV